MSKNLLLIILVGIFLGCSATAGRKFDTTAINRIDVGQTTESEVIAMLGVPVSENRLTNGIDLYNYCYGETMPFWFGTTVDSLQVQLYNGVVIDKWQKLRHN